MVCIYFSSLTNSALIKLIQDKPNVFFMPEITYSIANAPSNKPNTLWITLNKDIKEDQIITWKDVDYLSDDPTVSYRRSMEKNFRSLLD